MEKVAEGQEISKALKVEKVDLRHTESRIAEIVKEKPLLKRT